jgi:hypothetical protein
LDTYRKVCIAPTPEFVKSLRICAPGISPRRNGSDFFGEIRIPSQRAALCSLDRCHFSQNRDQVCELKSHGMQFVLS